MRQVLFVGCFVTCAPTLTSLKVPWYPSCYKPSFLVLQWIGVCTPNPQLGLYCEKFRDDAKRNPLRRCGPKHFSRVASRADLMAFLSFSSRNLTHIPSGERRVLRRARLGSPLRDISFHFDDLFSCRPRELSILQLGEDPPRNKLGLRIQSISTSHDEIYIYRTLIWS